MSLAEEDEPLPLQVELRPGRLKWLVIFLISAGFVAIAVFLGPEDKPVTRWLSGGFFVLCGLIAAPQFFGVGARLRLDETGFTCTTLFRSFRREWRECSEFAPAQVGPNLMVGFSTERDLREHPKLARVALAVAGTAGALPDTFGVSADELAELMNRFRARALGASPLLTAS